MPESDPPVSTGGKSIPTARWIRVLIKILDANFVIVFLSVVVHSFRATHQFGQLFACLFPPAICYVFARSPISRPSTKAVTASFLTMISLGDIVAYFAPALGKNRIDGLPPQESVLLAWYIVCYVVFLFAILPPLLFIRPFIDRRHRRPAQFSALTCILGLLLWLIMGPFAIVSVVRFLIQVQ